MLPAVYVFDRWISMYWVSAAVGIVFAYALAMLRARSGRFRTPGRHVFFTMMVMVIGGRIGGVVFKAIGHIFLYASVPGFWTIRNWTVILRSGGVFYGGLIIGFLAALAYIRIMKLDLRDVADILTPSVPLFLVFGRVGCFLAGCCYGRAWGIMPNGLFPVQLLEAAFNLLIVVEMLRLRPERERPGILLPMYFGVYAVGRFIIEFMRGDAHRGVYLLSTSQWISLAILFVLTAIFLVKRRKRGQRLRAPST